MNRSDSHQVPRRELAPGYWVARIINGGWQLSRGHRQETVEASAALAQMQQLVEAGFNTFDCGDIYVGVEELFGQLRQISADIKVHTKFVPDRDALPRMDRRYVERIVDRSLRRLGMERLDLVQFSWWDYDVARYVETAVWLNELRQAGKIRHLGVTNFDVHHLAEIVAAGVPLVSHQVQYSLIDRRPERGMRQYCSEHGIHLITYGSLAGGFLTQRYLGAADPQPPLVNRSLTKYRLVIQEFGGWVRFQELLSVLARIAARHDASVANVALCWSLQQGGVAAAIVGAFDASHLHDNLRAFDFQLDDADLGLLESFADAGPAGDVYAAERVPDGVHAAIMKYNLNSTLSE